MDLREFFSKWTKWTGFGGQRERERERETEKGTEIEKSREGVVLFDSLSLFISQTCCSAEDLNVDHFGVLFVSSLCPH